MNTQQDTSSGWRRWLGAGGFALTALLALGCATGEDVTGGNTFGSPTLGAGGQDEADDADDDDEDDDGPAGGACLMNNCEQDLECTGCNDGATICDTDEGRCVQCDPQSQVGCAANETCSDFGNCVPGGVDCPTADGLPTVDCNADTDCAACDPRHQVCDTSTNACVACSDENAEGCQTIEHCEDSACVANCPESCDSDSDCGECGTDGHEAHACNAHACTQCNSANPCTNGLTCNQHGACVEICGLPGQVAGTCDEDSDCSGCPGDATNCIAPINGGHGTCGASASGCSDIGNGVVVLPDPFDQVTNACSNDGDCNGVGIQYNVGQLLRELTGIDSIDDANVEYPMAVCAAATLEVGPNSISCGICVPCKEDDDCQDIDVDEVAGDAFGPLGAIASAVLLDQLFGPNDHMIHMFCQPVAQGFGACVPCPSLLSDCAGPPAGGGSGNCDHDTCTEGGPLDPSCGTCAEAVCAADDFCCNEAWDSLCIDQVAEHCAGGCGGANGGQCSHNPCNEGDALAAACSSCTDAVCDEDAYCCQTAWDGICVGLAAGVSACGCDGGGSDCAHDECSLGGPLTEGCSACTAAVCAGDSFCCETDWDQYCVDSAAAEAACDC